MQRVLKLLLSGLTPLEKGGVLASRKSQCKEEVCQGKVTLCDEISSICVVRGF